MRKREQGILTVEASIILTVMLLFVLFLFSFIRIYRAENAISHATIQAVDAMALESYLRENALDEKADDVVYLANRLTGATSLKSANFESLRSADIPTLAKEKLVAALSTSDSEADKLLKNYGVKDGLSGIDLSASKIDLDNDDIILSAAYTVKIQFPIFGVTEIDLTKSAKAKTFGEILFEVLTESNNKNMGSTTGGGSFKHGTMIEIRAVPNYGYKFVKWNDGNKDNPRMVTVTDAKKYIAIFEPDNFGVNVVIKPNNAGTVTGAGTYKYLTKANLSVTAKPGYQFEKWSIYKHKDATTSFSTSKNLSQTVDQSYTFTANFTTNSYTIKVATSGASGTVNVKSGSKYGNSVKVSYGDIFSLVQTAPTGYTFKGWKMQGGNSYISSTNNIAVPGTYPNGSVIPNGATITYTAYYEKTKYYVNVITDGHGSAYGGGQFEYGQITNLSASPYDGYLFDYWTVVSGSTGGGSNGQYKIVDNITVKAVFKTHKHKYIYRCSTAHPVNFFRGYGTGGCGYFHYSNANYLKNKKDNLIPMKHKNKPTCYCQVCECGAVSDYFWCGTHGAGKTVHSCNFHKK